MMMMMMNIEFQHNNNHRFTDGHSHYTGQPALSGTSRLELEDFAGAKFYCPHALADGNQRIRVTEKTLEFSSTVLSTLSQKKHFNFVHKITTDNCKILLDSLSYLVEYQLRLG